MAVLLGYDHQKRYQKPGEGMNEALQKQLEHYLSRLQGEREERGNRAKVVSMYAEAIGRCYDLLEEREKAREFFTLAAEKWLESLINPHGIPVSRPDHVGRENLIYARLLWRMESREANSYFQKTLEEYEKGHEWELEGVRYDCWKGTIFCSIFLEDYETARAAAAVCRQIEQNSKLSYEGNTIQELTVVIESCQQATREAYTEALSVLAAHFKRERLELFGRSPIPEIDVYEFVKRKLSLLEAQG